MHLSMCAQEFKLALKNLGTGIRTGQKVFQQGLKAFDELEKKWEDYLCLCMRYCGDYTAYLLVKWR